MATADVDESRAKGLGGVTADVPGDDRLRSVIVCTSYTPARELIRRNISWTRSEIPDRREPKVREVVSLCADAVIGIDNIIPCTT
jgi:hypothetical protein